MTIPNFTHTGSGLGTRLVYPHGIVYTSTGISINQFSLVNSQSTCPSEEVLTQSVVFQWPETASGSVATFTCPNNDTFNVSRQCLDGGRWEEFDEGGCRVLSAQLDDISISSQNVRI